MSDKTQRVRPFGVDFVSATEVEMASVLSGSAIPAGEGCRLLVTMNLSHVVDLSRNEAFRQAYKAAWKVTVDGTPVLLYSRLRGLPLRERCTGSGLFHQLMSKLEPDQHRIFFLAPQQDVADRCKDHLVRNRGFPAEAIDYVIPPKGFETDRQLSRSLCEHIADHGTTHLFLGVGAPKSEIWVHEHRERLGACYALCVGAGLEFFVGAKSRGPVWMREIGMEWFWRFLTEPRRLMRRYFIDSWRFLVCVIDDLMGRPLLHR